MDLFGKKAAKENEALRQEIQRLTEKLDYLGYDEFEQVKKELERTLVEIQENKETIASLRLKVQDETEKTNGIILTLNQRIEELTQKEQKVQKQVKTATNKLAKAKELYGSVEYSISQFFEYDPQLEHCKLSAADSAAYDDLSPSVILKLHLMDVKSLRKAYRDNDKQIESVLTKYAARYTTKANQTIYKLMVIALRAELQNILYSLKYEKLDDAVEKVKEVTAKYLAIVSEGNQSIAGTMTKFVGEIEYLFINAVKIEYNYYVKKEQAKQEQAAIREQMRQEAAERKALEEERKKIEAEESKYHDEINRIKQQMEQAAENEAEALKRRILELESKLSDVAVKKEEIVNLQNGKAGNVYVISNMGSFGENMFKVGMTRRLDPQDRVDELGSASVPFKFDVHCFIFSEDAVSLESKLHQSLNDKRVNKVNLRKEFFYSSVDELEKLVMSIDPTAEFNKTMLAEEFRQSQSTDAVYTSEVTTSDDEEK